MLRVRHVGFVLLLAASFASSSCGDPPDKEIQQAQGAIEAARAAGADRYATQEFSAAQEAMKLALEAVTASDYRLALNHALDSRERAQNSAKLAADGKAAARVEADRALTAAADALTGARTTLKSAPKSAARQAVADAERRLQEARSAFDRGEYSESVKIAAAIIAALSKATSDPDPAPGGGNRRRR
jgi:hypothetical protein